MLGVVGCHPNALYWQLPPRHKIFHLAAPLAAWLLPSMKDVAVKSKNLLHIQMTKLGACHFSEWAEGSSIRQRLHIEGHSVWTVPHLKIKIPCFQNGLPLVSGWEKKKIYINPFSSE